MDPCTCWRLCKTLCDRINMMALIDSVSAGQKNDMNDISSTSWHHRLPLTGKLWGCLKQLKAQSSLTFKSADFPHLEGILPANLNRPWTWTGGLFDSWNIRSLKICQHQPRNSPAGEFRPTCVIKAKSLLPNAHHWSTLPLIQHNTWKSRRKRVSNTLSDPLENEWALSFDRSSNVRG